jgi:hypothetical protein
MALLESSLSASRSRDGWTATLSAEPCQRPRSAAAHCGCEWMKVIAGSLAPISDPSTNETALPKAHTQARRRSFPVLSHHRPMSPTSRQGPSQPTLARFRDGAVL